MAAVFGLLMIIVVSLVVVRIGAIALELTGLSGEIASFQAQSAFSGVGFTTAEAEMIVTHPVRRKIIRILILMGSAGITSSMAALVLTFVGEKGKDVVLRGSILVGGILLIFLIARSRVIYILMKRLITKMLRKWTHLKIYDYEQLLGLSQGYSISRVAVAHNSCFRDKKLSDLKPEEGILVLSIYRKVEGRETYIGAPHGDTVIHAGDVLICYSRSEDLKVLTDVCRAR